MKLDTKAIERVPYPPTINHYYGYQCRRCHSNAVIVYPTAAAKRYRKAVAEIAGTAEPLEGRLACTIELWTPDRRARDLDNPTKAILDAVTAAGLWPDDKVVDRLLIERAGVKPGGEVLVTIEQLERRLF